MRIVLWIVLGLINVPLTIGIAWLFFGTWQRMLLTVLSVFGWIVGLGVSEDAADDQVFNPLKLICFLFTCAAFGYVQFLLLNWLGLA